MKKEIASSSVCMKRNKRKKKHIFLRIEDKEHSQAQKKKPFSVRMAARKRTKQPTRIQHSKRNENQIWLKQQIHYPVCVTAEFGLKSVQCECIWLSQWNAWEPLSFIIRISPNTIARDFVFFFRELTKRFS